MARWPAILSAVALCGAFGCASGRRVALTPLDTTPCPAATPATGWVAPDEATGGADRPLLSAWCESVGPAIVSRRVPDGPTDVSAAGLIVATWNIHEGGGDLQRFVGYLRRQRGVSSIPPALVILLQEVARADDGVPGEFPRSVRAPGRIRPADAPSFDIAAVASSLGMSLAYVPSMRNGGDVASGAREDRGSAILSTLPLTDVVGIELPWVSQRRVAVMATLTAVRNGAPWRLHVISVHLDNRPGRSRQAAALAGFASTMPAGEPVVIGGDLNTWLGPAESTVRQLDAVVPRVTTCGAAPTFMLGLRLDHLFTTIAPSLMTQCEIVRDFFGSDHRPTALHLFR